MHAPPSNYRTTRQTLNSARMIIKIIFSTQETLASYSDLAR